MSERKERKVVKIGDNPPFLSHECKQHDCPVCSPFAKWWHKYMRNYGYTRALEAYKAARERGR